MRIPRTLAWTPALLLLLAVATTPALLVDDANVPVVAEEGRSAGPILVGHAGGTDVATIETAPAVSTSDVPAPLATEEPVQDPAEYMRDGLPLTETHPLVAPVIAVQDRHTDRLLEHPSVVGTATGMNARGQIAILIYTKDEVRDLPSFIEGVPVVIHVSGEIHASARGGVPGPPGGNGGGGDDVDPKARFERPVPIGVSTGHPNITAGTIGCRVTDGTNVYALSNNHVYADENGASPGDDVIQPGTFDGGSSPADNLGTLDDFEAIVFSSSANNEIDAAISFTTTDDLGVGTPSDGYGVPQTTTVSATINKKVMKYGRTTGQTNGRIGGINGTFLIGYDSGVARFVNQISVNKGSFSAGGDSGSLVVVQSGADKGKAVGLLFAGGSGLTILNPIDAVLSRFGVTIDDGN